MSHIDRIVEAIHNPPDDILSWLEAEYQQEQDNILVLECKLFIGLGGLIRCCNMLADTAGLDSSTGTRPVVSSRKDHESSMRHAGIDPNKPNLVISNAGIRVKALCSSTSL